MSWYHDTPGDPEKSPYSGLNIFFDQMKSSGRDSARSPYKPKDSEYMSRDINPGDPIFYWLEYPKLGCFADFCELAIPEKYLKEIKELSEQNNQPHALVFQEYIKRKLVFLGSAAVKTPNSMYPNSNLQDKNIAITRTNPVQVVISEKDGVNVGDALAFVVPDPTIKRNRYLATFEIVKRSDPHFAAKRCCTSISKKRCGEQGLADLVI